MAVCQHCDAELFANAVRCERCGGAVASHEEHGPLWVSDVYATRRIRTSTSASCKGRPQSRTCTTVATG